MSRALALVALLAAANAHAEPHKKSRTLAQALSGLGAGVSGALVITSMFTGGQLGQVNMPLLYVGVGVSTIAPSAGEWYAGEWLSWGMGVRAIAGATAIVIAQTQTQTQTCNTGVGSCTTLTGAGVALLGIAGIAYLGGIAYDVIDAGDAVDRYNRAHGFTLDVTPMVVPTPSGTTPMLLVSGRW
jgi:hypothetical protein